MAISTSYDWTHYTDQLITQTLRHMGVLSRSQMASELQLYDGKQVLNRMVKSWQAKKIFLWTIEEDHKVITASSEVTGTDSNIYTCILSHTAALTNKPITGADWNKYWVLYGSTGGTWTLSTAYTCAGVFDVDADCVGIDKAWIRDASGSMTPIEIISGTKFTTLDRNDFGSVTHMWLEKLAPLTANRMRCYPIPDDDDEVIYYNKIRKLRDFDRGVDDADFPAHWQDALVCNLSYKWARNFHLDPQAFKSEAIESFNEAYGGEMDDDDNDFIAPSFRV